MLRTNLAPNNDESRFGHYPSSQQEEFWKKKTHFSTDGNFFYIKKFTKEVTEPK